MNETTSKQRRKKQSHGYSEFIRIGVTSEDAEMIDEAVKLDGRITRADFVRVHILKLAQSITLQSRQFRLLQQQFGVMAQQSDVTKSLSFLLELAKKQITTVPGEDDPDEN
jgi:uncharacterized protein (DUF1778 family)